MKNSKYNPWKWIPTLYITEALPYVTVMSISVVMYKRLNLSNTEIALYTSWLYLPWVIKPFWSPVVDLLRNKRWWIVITQILLGAGLAGVAFCIPTTHFVQTTLAFFWLVAFSSATHDIAADSYYMSVLQEHEQALYVGVRSTFYRIGTIAGQGLLIMLAGTLEVYTSNIARSWSLMFYILAAFLLLIALYHQIILPRNERVSASGSASARYFLKNFMEAFVSFFRKRQFVAGALFMLLFRFPEALLIKVSNMYLIDPVNKGGLGLTTQEVGLVQGTIGVLGLTVGGIIGGIVIAQGGLRKWLWPMTWSITLPNLVYVYMSYSYPDSLLLISSCIFLEQFGYGFGFSAYMLYLIYYCRGKYQAAHYAICTAFMALSMMIPGMFAGWIQEQIGYFYFFLFVIACCPLTIWVSSLLKIDPQFGKKQ